MELTEQILEVTELDAAARTRDGQALDDFMAEWSRQVALPMRGLTPEERRYRFYTRYNLERRARVLENYEPSQALRDALSQIPGPQTWLFLTEYWCADAAYSQPIVEAAADLHGSADLRFLLRDENLDVMERYLTGRSRSIPILAVFDAEGREILRWGSKPAALAAHRAELKAAGADGAAVSAATIAWYEADGWLEVEKELAARFKAAAPGE